MSNNSKNVIDSWEVCNGFYLHMFPSDDIDDCAFQRSCAGLVRSWTDLVLPPSMTLPSTLNLSSWGPLFIMSQKTSHTPVTVARSPEKVRIQL